MGDPAGNFQNRTLAQMSPDLVLNGDKPRLIDEWQEVPPLWDAVRYKVDQTGEKGQFILTGSATPNHKGIMHSGAGRIARIKMHPMSLYESGDSSGEISLKELCNDNIIPVMTGEVNLQNLIKYIIRGGWPGNIDIPVEQAALLPIQYIDAIIDDDVYRMDGVKRNKEKMKLLLRSLARNEATTVTNTSLARDVKEMDDTDLDKDTIADLNALQAKIDQQKAAAEALQKEGTENKWLQFRPIFNALMGLDGDPNNKVNTQMLFYPKNSSGGSVVHPDGVEWTFENADMSDAVMHRAKNYVENWDEMQRNHIGCLFWGPVGTGKSYIAGCIANELLKREVTVKMTNFNTIIDDIFPLADKTEYINALASYQLLIIDDLGVERNSEYALGIIFSVIDRRIRSGRPLIITTNLPLKEIKNETMLDKRRIYDRILEMCTPMYVGGTSKREAIASMKMEKAKTLLNTNRGEEKCE